MPFIQGRGGWKGAPPEAPMEIQRAACLPALPALPAACVLPRPPAPISGRHCGLHPPTAPGSDGEKAAGRPLAPPSLRSRGRAAPSRAPGRPPAEKPPFLPRSPTLAPASSPALSPSPPRPTLQGRPTHALMVPPHVAPLLVRGQVPVPAHQLIQKLGRRNHGAPSFLPPSVRLSFSPSGRLRAPVLLPPPPHPQPSPAAPLRA